MNKTQTQLKLFTISRSFRQYLSPSYGQDDLNWWLCTMDIGWSNRSKHIYIQYLSMNLTFYTILDLNLYLLNFTSLHNRLPLYRDTAVLCVLLMVYNWKHSFLTKVTIYNKHLILIWFNKILYRKIKLWLLILNVAKSYILVLFMAVSFSVAWLRSKVVQREVFLKCCLSLDCRKSWK